MTIGKLAVDKSWATLGAFILGVAPAAIASNTTASTLATRAATSMTPPASIARPSNPLSDAEPHDPAEDRPAIVPPLRTLRRGAAATWQSLGPAPTQNAQLSVSPSNEISGAVHALAPHPVNANILYAGAVNGGIWRTDNATAAQPVWTAQTEFMPSQSIASLAFDTLDGSHQTLIAGIGRLSNFAQRGDDEIGVYYTTNGGSSWSNLGGLTLVGKKIVGVAARGPILMAAATSGGLYRSVNSGANWTQMSGGTGGLASGGIFDLAADPGNSSRFYVSLNTNPPQVFRSDNSGADWTKVSTGIPGLSGGSSQFRLSVGASGAVFAANVTSGILSAVYRSADLGVTWTSMDVPSIHPGGQGAPNTSLAADPLNANRVYIGGDRITNSPYTGNLVRGDASLAAGSQFTTIMDGNGSNTTPHADSRNMVFDAAGNLLQCDDGGIYRRSAPASSGGAWSAVVGNLNVMEVHDLAQDRVANIIIIGTQDNGTHIQIADGNPRWNWINGGDGGDVEADSVTQAPNNAYRYLSSQNLGGFRRRAYNSANALTGSLSLPSIPDPQFVTPIELNIADPSRMLVAGTNTVYEITGINGSLPTLNNLGSPGANRNAVANGSHSNADAAYVGKNTAVFRRDGALFVATAALPAGAATITDVAMDPDDDQHVYAIDDNQVFRSTDAGATWQDITGNLGAISSSDFRSIEYIAHAPSDQLALGTRSGVFTAAVGSSAWSELGSGLPDVLVFDLRYVQSNDTLIAGTLGRGVWRHAFPGDTVFANGFEN